MRALVVAEHLGGQVREISYELITAAASLGATVSVAAIGSEPSSLALDREGVDEVVCVTVENDEFESDPYQAAIESLIVVREPDVVLFGFTVSSMSVAPAIAAKLGFGFASDVFALGLDEGRLVATRAYYGGKAHAELVFPEDAPIVLMLRPATWSAAPPAADRPQVTTHAAPPIHSRARHREFREVERGDVDITTADFLLSVGGGIGDKDSLQIFEELAARLGATLAVSRPIVDAGWASSLRLVGQSGKTVSPRVYLALGISGAVQHLAGMKTSGTIIAVNTDPEAAIFEVAHYGAVADLFEVAEELTKLL